MRAQSELRKMTISLMLFSALLVGGFSFYTDLVQKAGGNVEDLSYLNQTIELNKINNNLTSRSDLKEEDVGGFLILRGGVSLWKSLTETINIATTSVGTFGSRIGMPLFIQDNFVQIIVFIGLLSFGGIVWSRLRA